MKSIDKYWPQILQEVKELKEIARAENPEIEDVWQSLDYLMDDQFIETATEKGIARREKLLKIIPFADDDLESRRFRVATQWDNQLPYTHRQLINKLNDMVGENGYTINTTNRHIDLAEYTHAQMGQYTHAYFQLSSNYQGYALNIKINLGQKRMLQTVDKMVRNMAPCNLVISVELRYNRHKDLAVLTHQELATRTHFELREEVLY